MVTDGLAVEAEFDRRLPAACGREKRASINYVPGGPAVSADPAAESRMPIIEM
jgi:hypothetical protein